MKFTKKTITTGKEILHNMPYVAIPYNCEKLTALATENVIPAGTIIPANDATALGVLLSDVNLAGNPNGTIVIDGFIDKAKLPEAPTAEAMTALKQVTFLPFETATTTPVTPPETTEPTV